MASTIRVRAIAGAETTEVQALIQHPMDSGFVKDAQGTLIPPHHIETVQFEAGGKTVFTALWGPAVSKDPFVKFSFKGAKKATTSRSPGSTTKAQRIRRRQRFNKLVEERKGADGA
jgi:sulfur-oxidizing protein SoxZ